MIIDDSALMRRIVAKALRETGIEMNEVLEAGNGAEGIAVLRDKTTDLIFCDVHMPAMDGVSFLRQRSALGFATMPVIMVTADAGDPMVAEALASGASGFIAKPFSSQEVREQVLALMEHA